MVDMVDLLWALLWLTVALLGVCTYATVGLTLSKMNRPTIQGNGVPLRIGSTLALAAAEAGWLTWAALTTNFADCGPMNGTAVFAGGILLVIGTCVVWACETYSLRVLAQAVWPIALAGWLIGHATVATSVSIAKRLDRVASLAAGRREHQEAWLTAEGREFDRLRAEARRDLERTYTGGGG